MARIPLSLVTALVFAGGCGDDTVAPSAADLSVEVSDDRDPVFTGTFVQYTHVVTNLGPGPATEVDLHTRSIGGTIQLPQVSGVAACRNEGAGVVCTIGTLASGESRTIVLNVLAPDQAGQITQDASAFGDDPDPVPTNDDDTETTVVVAPRLDFSVVKRSDKPAVELGSGDFTFEIEITNTGDVGIASIQVSDPHSGSFTLDPSQLPTGCEIDAISIECNLDSPPALAPGLAITLRYRAIPSQTGVFTNIATVTAEGTLTKAASAQVTVTAPPPQFIPQITATPDEVAVNAPVSITLEAENTGLVPITTITGTLTLPGQVTIVPGSLSAGCTSQGTTVTCAANTLLNPGALFEPVVLFNVSSNQAGTFAINGSFTANGSTNRLVSTSFDVLIPTPPEFAVNLEIDDDILTVGQTTGLSLNITNQGTTAISQLLVELTLGAGARFAGLEPPATNLSRLIELASTPIEPSQIRKVDLPEFEAVTVSSVPINGTVTANGLTTRPVSGQVQIVPTAPDAETFILLPNLNGLFGLSVNHGPPFDPFEIILPGRSGSSEGATFAVNGSASAFIVFNSKHVVRLDVQPSGPFRSADALPDNASLFTEGASISLAEIPFNVAVNRQGSCVAVPLQSAGVIQQLTANLVDAGQLALPGGFPTRVQFNPMHDVAYIADGTKIVVASVNPATCSLTQTGAPPTYTNRRYTEVDSRGEFLHVLTYNLFGATSTLVLQRLANGLPTGVPTVTPLPAGANQVIPHPTQDVVYVVQDAPNQGVRRVTFDRVAGTYTVGSLFAGGNVDELAFTPDASRLYYTEVTNFDKGRICWVDLTPAGDFSGGSTCQTEVPPRGRIDSDILIIRRPQAAGQPSRRP
jgi:hypothetical protein